MYCYYCGAWLDSSDYCPNCEADVHMVKKIQAVSNRWYNEGLARVKVRDLSGAAEALQKSLKWSKMNMDARNLLGLIYYEMGESVDAVSQWVLSKSLIPEDNPATEYLNKVQNSNSQIDKLNQTSKKFNQALTYSLQNNDDLAIIQLKKVLSTNPKLVKGHQLLALLYMKNGRYDLAKKALKNAGRIDVNNVRTLTFLRECNEQLKASGKKRHQKNDDDEIISYESGNDIIIRPRRFIDNTMVMSVVNLLIGAAIGIAVVCFLIVPSIKQNAQNEANMSVVKANETLSVKEQDIKDLQTQIDTLTQQVSTAQADSEAAANMVKSYEELMEAYVYYAKGENLKVVNVLEGIDKDALDNTGQQNYDLLLGKVQDALVGKQYTDGIAAYEEENYTEAVAKLSEVVASEQNYKDGKAMYFLAHSYRKLKDGENAIKWFQKCIDGDFALDETDESIQDYIDYIKAQPETYGLDAE